MGYSDSYIKREYQRGWIAERRAKWFADKSCVKCGSTEALQLDHIDPSSKTTHRIWSWSWKRIEEETAKCQVLCTPCHKDKTKTNKEHYNPTKISEDQVKEIRSLLAEKKLTQKQIGNLFGVSRYVIYGIKTRKGHWK